MQNKNFYREYNKPIKESHYETIFGGIMIGLVVVAFSLLSYGFWDSLFQMFQEVTMELSKETQNKIWAITDVVTSQYESDRRTSWKSKQEKN